MTHFNLISLFAKKSGRSNDVFMDVVIDAFILLFWYGVIHLVRKQNFPKN